MRIHATDDYGQEDVQIRKLINYYVSQLKNQQAKPTIYNLIVILRENHKDLFDCHGYSVLRAHISYVIKRGGIPNKVTSNQGIQEKHEAPVYYQDRSPDLRFARKRLQSFMKRYATKIEKSYTRKSA